MAVSEELEAAIRANPDAVEPYLVYADWLQAQADPRGELIALMAEPAPTSSVQSAIDHLMAEHAQHLVGALADHGTIRLTWRWGFLESAHVRRYAESGVSKRRLLEQLLDLHAARFLRVLTLVSDDRGELARVVASRRSETIRRFYLDEQHQCDLVQLPAALPNVEELVVKSGVVKLGTFSFASLRSLRLDLARIEDRDVLRGEWPRLERLELTPGARLLLRIDPVQMRKLTCISLRHPDLGADLDVLGLVGSSPLLRQIRQLEVWACTLRETSARALVECGDRFGHLDRIVVSSGLRAEVLEALKGIGPEILVR